MEPEGSLPHSQVPATCLYPNSYQFSPCLHILQRHGIVSLQMSVFITEECNAVVNSDKLALGSCDRALWAKYEDRKTNKMQQLDVYY